MKLLPYYFKWIGITVFLIGFIINTIDEGRRDFMKGYNEYRIDHGEEVVEYNFQPILPEKLMHISDFTMLIGLLLYILSKNKQEDEFAQKLRYESAFIVLVLSILIILIVYIVNSEIRIEPSFLISSQMFAYLILRVLKRKIILWEDYEEQS